MGDIEKELKKLLNEVQEMKENQKIMNDKINKMQNVINHIQSDMYMDDQFDFEIICPYCENEFLVDMDENETEVKCPECNNIIELDWSGEFDDTDSCHGGCGGCHGCGSCDEEDDM